MEQERPLSLHSQRVYPLSNGNIDRSCSSLALSSLSLSDNSDDSLPDVTNSAPSHAAVGSGEPRKWKTKKEDDRAKKRVSQCHEISHNNNYARPEKIQDLRSFDPDIWRHCFSGLIVQHSGCKRQVLSSREAAPASSRNDASLKRCNWLTRSSDQVIVSFHDECWGVPVFNDRRLFELLSMSGLLIDHNWTEILKRRALYRELFANFDHNVVANMGEEDIKKISSIKKLTLGERRVRCILDNAKCIQKEPLSRAQARFTRKRIVKEAPKKLQKPTEDVLSLMSQTNGRNEVAKEYGSFSGYIWSHVNHRPTVNKLKYPKRRSLWKTSRSVSISEDLVRRGFRQVGAVVVYSFMQATGMVNDHDVDCFRFHECVGIAERSWGMTNVAV